MHERPLRCTHLSLVDDFTHARLDREDGEFLDGAGLLPLHGHRQRQIRLHHACLQPVRGRSALRCAEVISQKYRRVQILSLSDIPFAICYLHNIPFRWKTFLPRFSATATALFRNVNRACYHAQNTLAARGLLGPSMIQMKAVKPVGSEKKRKGRYLRRLETP